MKSTRRIIILAILMMATCTAMRADDLSDLVAAVAGTVERVRSDSRIVQFDSLPRYEANEEKPDLDLLDGIYQAMTFQASLDYILNAYDYRTPSYLSTPPPLEYHSRPTLGRSDFYRPVPGMITSRYGWRPQFNRMHHGIDMRLSIGDTVRAAVSGTVKKIAYDHGGYGNYVVISHDDGMETLYGHLSYALVSQGQQIEIGRPLGIGGNTGNSTGPHLHFEARLGGVAIDPTLIFDFYGSYRSRTAGNITDSTASAHTSGSISGRRTYVVRQGDTARSVARRAGISVEKLCRLNMLRATEPLQVGRMLKLK